MNESSIIESITRTFPGVDFDNKHMVLMILQIMLKIKKQKRSRPPPPTPTPRLPFDLEKLKDPVFAEMFQTESGADL